MNKLEIGMYVRTKRDGIGKILSFELQDEEDYCFIELPHRRTGIKFFNIIKASFDIIDLIEVGDYVNGYKINDFRNDDGDYYLGIVKEDDEWANIIPLSKIEIKSIVTKEQFEKMKYEVE